MDSGQAELASAALFASLVGTWLGMCILLLCTMGAADYLKAMPWQTIGVRIVGSWMTASALLVLSLSLSSLQTR
jgi:urease accessory protein